MPNTVLVHKCFNGENFGPVSVLVAGTRSPEYFTQIPDNHVCSCRKYISTKDRDTLLGRNEIYLVLRLNSNGRAVPNWNEVVALRRQAWVPRGATVEKAHIERALIGNQEDEIERLEAYGILSEMTWVFLGASLRKRATESPSVPLNLLREPLERSFIVQFGDGRTKLTGAASQTVNPAPFEQCRRCASVLNNLALYPLFSPFQKFIRCPFCLEAEGFDVPEKTKGIVVSPKAYMEYTKALGDALCRTAKATIEQDKREQVA